MTREELEVGQIVTWCYFHFSGGTFWRIGEVEKINNKTATILMNRDNNRSVVPPKKMRVRIESLRVK